DRARRGTFTMIIPGMQLPAFKTIACVSIERGKEFQEIRSQDLLGSWVVLYTYPKDFTFVCPTEIVEFDARSRDFADRDAKLFGGSTDNEHSHLAWRKDHADLRALHHPLLFVSPQMARDWGILHPTEGVALRATLIIDPAGSVRFASVNDLSVGRNVDEVLRVLDALRTGELCACNWEKGQATLTQQLKAAL
ncbi:MAG TPA: peroxiredoxin, partial [Polyangiaceae bacterium]|nr:peroxiredoxin [Polyangiaceae bacterium]